MTTSISRDLLVRLGNGEPIANVCQGRGVDRSRFDSLWREECRRRVPLSSGTLKVAGLKGAARIARNKLGIPTISAENDADLFFGFGYATAQDRLFQLDYLRRKAGGRLAEVLGAEAIESDLLARTLGLPRIAAAEWEHLPAESCDLIAAYSAGVNALIEQSRELLPIEFDLLDYRPEPWSPLDCLLIAGEFRWYLTGRFYVIVLPELVKRAVGDGPLYDAFLQGEADEESILPPGSYAPGRTQAGPTGDGGGGPGSNNWVLAGSRTTTGKPIVASDPHVPFAAVSWWHQVCLCGGSFRVAGTAYTGMPAVMIGRNERVAWGVTNNICSLRDLYQEKTDPAHPECFLYDGRWEPARERTELIRVRGGADVRKVIRSSRNGPIVNDVLPSAGRDTGPVSLRWLGFDPCGWLSAMHGMDRARNAAEFREATRPWLVPTFNVVYADVEGNIGMQSTGRIPRRRVPERGYRPGWDPQHQWDGTLSFEQMPHLFNPAQGFAVTANNRLAPDDYPHPLFGTWSSGQRAQRIRQMIEQKPQLSREDCLAMQHDVLSLRAQAGVPHLVRLLAGDANERVRHAAEELARWDCRSDPGSVPPSLFHLFFARWCREVADERLAPAAAVLAADRCGGLAADLLEGDREGWFHRRDRAATVRAAFHATLEDLATRFGPDWRGWTWGRVHTLLQRHFLSARGELGQLLDRSGAPCRGDGATVCNTSADAAGAAHMGAGYRMTADLADPAAGLWHIEVGSVSGHPGSPHYDDQIAAWSAGRCHYQTLGDEAEAAGVLVLRPA